MRSSVLNLRFPLAHILAWFAVLLVEWACVQGQSLPVHNLFDRFEEPGIEIPGGVMYPVAKPALTPDQTKSERLEILHSMSGKLGWEAFSRRSPVAPVTIEVQSISDASGKRVGHSIHSAFIAYADMEKLRDRQLMQAMFGKIEETDDSSNEKPEAMSMTELTSEEMSQLGIEPTDSARNTYLKVELPLLGKVIIRGVLHLQKQEGPDWFHLYWQLDPQCNSTENPSVAQHSNRWTMLQPNSVGKLEESKPFPYAGCGGYLSVVATGLEPEQLLVETQLVLHEPVEWFAGSNYLRAKLPLTMQESARSFRRRIMREQTR